MAGGDRQARSRTACDAQGNKHLSQESRSFSGASIDQGKVYGVTRLVSRRRQSPSAWLSNVLEKGHDDRVFTFA